MKILPLQSHHDTETFSCGNSALDKWFHRIAKQHLSKGISRTYVAENPEDSRAVLGFYSLTVGEAQTANLPATVAKALPRKIPIVLIGRLGVDARAQGRGLGGLLLIDALQRTVRVATQVGIAAILVDAKDANTACFYQHFGFQPLPDSPNQLVLPIQTVAALFGSQ
jgi:GNAT superfamily N-acetyltransferase